MLIDAINPALQDREIPLNGVGVDLAPHVFLRAVVHGLMRDEIPSDTGIDAQLARGYGWQMTAPIGIAWRWPFGRERWYWL